MHFARTGEIIQIYGIIVNGNKSIEEEIKGRISLGNKAFYAIQDLFKIYYWLRISSYGCMKH